MMMIKPMTESFSPKLSCFWIIKGELIGTETKIKDAKQSGDYMIDPSLHFLIWDSVKASKPELENKDWEYYPRGRIRFNTRINQYEVFADSKIIDSSDCNDLIRQELGLPPTTLFKSDDHYESIASPFS